AEFVPSEKIDPVYFDKAYYLGPEKGADRAYRLLAEAMRRSGKTALARYAARGKQYLVQIRPLPEGGLVMQNLMYADEIRPFSEVVLHAIFCRDERLRSARGGEDARRLRVTGARVRARGLPRAYAGAARRAAVLLPGSGAAAHGARAGLRAHCAAARAQRIAQAEGAASRRQAAARRPHPRGGRSHRRRRRSRLVDAGVRA